MKKFISIFLICVILPIHAYAYSGTTLYWHTVYNNVSMHDCAYGNGKYVAIGDDNIVKISDDGENLTPTRIHGSGSYASIAYGNGIFVVTGTGAAVSTNGEKWTVCSDFQHEIASVAFNNGLFAAAGLLGQIYTSADGVEWVLRRSPSHENSDIHTIVPFREGFAASGYGKQICISADGIDWRDINQDYFIYNIASGNDRLLLYTDISVNEPNPTVLLSADGENWDEHPLPFGVSLVGDIIGTPEGFVAVEAFYGNSTPEGPTTDLIRMWTSSNGDDWSTDGVESDIGRFGDNVLHVLNGKTLFFANDIHFKQGADWKLATTQQGAFSVEGFTKSDNIAYNGQIYVKAHWAPPTIMGEGAVGMPNRAAISTSEDGENWNEKIYDHIPGLYSIAYGKGRFVAVGQLGTTLTSENGYDWTEIQDMTGSHLDLGAIIFDGKNFIVSGSNGRLYYSKDGVDFTVEQNIITGKYLSPLYFNDSEYVVMGGQLYDEVVIKSRRPLVFSDMTGHWGENYADTLSCRGIVFGAGDNLFVPDRSVTRGEFAAMLNRSFAFPDKADIPTISDAASDDWYYDAIVKMAQHGIMDGYGNGEMHPQNPITREEAMAMTVRAVNKIGININVPAPARKAEDYDDWETVSDWARVSVSECVEGNLIVGYDDTLMPHYEIKRSEASAIISRLLVRP